MASFARTLARPFVATGHWYSDAAKKRPVVTAVITTGLKTSAADLFAQKVSFFDFRGELLSFRRSPTLSTHLSVNKEEEEKARQGLSVAAASLSPCETRRDV